VRRIVEKWKQKFWPARGPRTVFQKKVAGGLDPFVGVTYIRLGSSILGSILPGSTVLAPCRPLSQLIILPDAAMITSRPEQREAQYARTMRHYVEPILPFFAEDEVSEIYTNPSTCEVWLGTHHGRQRTGIILPDVHIQAFLNTCAERQNETLDRRNEHLQAQLPLFIFHGARLQGLTPRIVERPCFNIRKRASVIYPLEDYVADGSLCRVHYEVLCTAIQERKNILVFGGMGSGKTTLVNAILNGMVEADPSEDFLILEDTQELQCSAEGTRYLTQTHTNGLRDLVKLTKRMFPGRIIVGEVRDEAALDLMNAWTSGHPGGAGTVHASSPIGALRKMATLARWATDTNHAATVAEAIDLLVGIERTSTGRVVRHVAWVGDALDADGNYVIDPVPSTGPEWPAGLGAASGMPGDEGASSLVAPQRPATATAPTTGSHRGPPTEPSSGPLVPAAFPHRTP